MASGHAKEHISYGVGKRWSDYDGNFCFICICWPPGGIDRPAYPSGGGGKGVEAGPFHPFFCSGRLTHPSFGVPAYEGCQILSTGRSQRVNEFSLLDNADHPCLFKLHHHQLRRLIFIQLKFLLLSGLKHLSVEQPIAHEPAESIDPDKDHERVVDPTETEAK